MNKFRISPLANAGDARYSTHEMPRWHSPSPMAASVIPRPIVPRPSSSASVSPVLQSKIVLTEQDAPLRDRQQELEADLQYLLDAQAEGLLRQSEADGLDDNISTGSATPTIKSTRRESSRSQAGSRRRKPGLGSARKGIYNTMSALRAVKDEELALLDTQVQDTDVSLAQIEEWEKKRSGLRAASQKLNENKENVRAQRLQDEADKLQAEIDKVESHLSDMKGRHGKLVRQIAVEENSVQAKVASYESSLRMLEEDVQKFLSIQPLSPPVRPTSADGPKTSVWQLPLKRRTLELAKDSLGQNLHTVMARRANVEREKEALEEGRAIWKDVVLQVTDFEKRLRAEMTSLSDAQASRSYRHSTSAWGEESPLAKEDAATEQTRELLRYLTHIIDNLEHKFRLAEDKEWNLLIAAVGAEIHALKEGKKIIQGVLGVADDEQHDAAATAAATVPEQLISVDPSAGSFQRAGEEVDAEGEEIDALNQSFQTALRRSVVSRRDPDVNDNEDDDDPDPELMFSRQDVNNE